MKRDPLGSSPMHIQKRGYPKGGKLSSNPGGIFNGILPSGISPACAGPVARNSAAMPDKSSLVLIGKFLLPLFVVILRQNLPLSQHLSSLAASVIPMHLKFSELIGGSV